MRGFVVVGVFAAVVMSGCSFEPFDRTDFPCPCGAGYECVVDRCQAVETDAGTDDADVGDASGDTHGDASVDLGDLYAFPSALGYGRDTVGGRGGEVIHVTNLNNSGEGSLRDALTTSVPRTVVFDVSGYITLEEPITIRSPFLTIAGQTAPGDGVVVRGQGLIVATSEVIIRYLQIRVGTEVAPAGERAPALELRAYEAVDGGQIVVDHCSILWGVDRNVVMAGTQETTLLNHVTIQNSIVAEPLGARANVFIGSNVVNASFVGNLLAHSFDQNPRNESHGRAEYEIVNNVVFDYQAGTSVTFGARVDLIGNVFLNAGASPERSCANYDSIGSFPEREATLGEVYQLDNRCVGNDFGLMNSRWLSYNSAEPTHPESVLLPIPSVDTEADVARSVGVGPVFDSPADRRLLGDLDERSGSRAPTSDDTEAHFGGFPEQPSETRPEGYDSDRDGMPDAWERARGFDSDDPGDSSLDPDGDGYTNLEVFLHELAPN